MREASKLAKSHRKDERKLEIFLFSKQDDTEIRLLEVSEYVFQLGKIIPFTFPPERSNSSYPLTLILVSPEDWTDIKQGKIKLPNDMWQLSSYMHFDKNGKQWEWVPVTQTA